MRASSPALTCEQSERPSAAVSASRTCGVRSHTPVVADTETCAVALRSPDTTRIVTVPAETAVAMPLSPTDTTEASSLVHVTGPGKGLPC